MIENVTWDDSTDFMGRNGSGKCNGVEVMTLSDGKNVMLSPITSKGSVANAWISVPKTEIRALIETLQKTAQ